VRPVQQQPRLHRSDAAAVPRRRVLRAVSIPRTFAARGPGEHPSRVP
jgi:hypothetical protein